MTYSEQLKHITDNSKILALDSYSINGQVYKVFQKHAWTEQYDSVTRFGSNRLTDPNVQQQQLVQHLCNKLYVLFYCGIPAELAEYPIPSVFARHEFMQTLSRHNQHSTFSDSGWRIYDVDKSGSISCQKNGLVRQAMKDSWQLMTGYSEAKVGSFIQFPRKPEDQQLQQVFYFIYGDAFQDHSAPKMRIYWHCKAEGAARLVAGISSVLNGYKVPFTFKCLNHPDLYVRRDSGVLYIEKKDFDFALKLLTKFVFPEVQSLLEPDSPWFTCPIIEGVSYAEDPDTVDSFGMHRCRLIAQALVNDYLSNGSATKRSQKPYTAVEQYLEVRGLPVSRLHLAPHTRSLPDTQNPPNGEKP